MPESLARLMVGTLAWYLGLGVLLAAALVTRLAGRLDPGASQGTWGFRVLIFPGAVLLWPLLLLKVVRAR